MRQQLQSLLKALAYRCGFSLRRLRQPARLGGAGGGRDFVGSVRAQIHAVDPYQGFDPAPFPEDTRGWGSDSPAFGELMEELRPQRVIEVGTWKGGSALTLAGHAARLELSCEIVSVDTWLGALEMWLDTGDATRYGSLRLRHGYPSLYYTFLANIVRAGRQDFITPFPVPSLTAAQWCAIRGVHAGLIYLDGSHEEEDVYQDLVTWWDILAPGGAMCGDDWSWDGVRLAVSRFAAEHALRIRHRHDKWELRRG